MLESLGSLIIQLIHQAGYAGIFALMTLESALIPIPSEVTMPFAGSLVNLGVFNFWLVGLIGALGNLTGSLAAYALGFQGEEVVRKLIRNYGKYILVKEKEFDLADHWFKKNGDVIVFVSRMLPVVRTYISLPAGIARTNLKKFVAYTFIGSLIWSYLLTYLGVILGSNWKSLEIYFRKFDLLIVVILILGAGFYVFRHVKRTA